MRPKILSGRISLIIIFLGLTLSVALFLYFIPNNTTEGSSALLVENVSALPNQEQEYQTQVIIVGLPVRLMIPIIQVNSAIIPVGLTPDGAMGVPKDPAEVVWFNLGPRPGENGSAVIAGHYDWIKNMPAVFDGLDKLVVGDKVFVLDENGVITNFVVRKIRTYGKDEVAFDVFGSNDGKAHLNLVTCAGIWNKKEKTYSDRLVVFTEKE